ncbi:MAG: 5-formyltetrahydrofolate cyclo-ligase [Bacillota bacterium]|nr:MAG: 5-formyltetrahydrofolate cyclo-ligase [Bacillota bacterium]MBS3951224.1 5-formyltetrahydrofolate cyclo-ligase [Peptococcaceae bacterium]
MTDKHHIRKAVLVKREGLPCEKQALFSSRVVEALRQSEVLARSTSILAYLPFRGEVDLSLLFDWLQDQGKKLAFPKIIDKANGYMEPYFVDTPWRNNVKPGAFNILEPEGDIRVANPALLDLVFVPGVAFDSESYRLGFGGGFYDRFLLRLGTHTLKVGIAYQFQVMAQIPRDPHDIALDGVCTERGLFLK